jgi:hypothetical protein
MTIGAIVTLERAVMSVLAQAGLNGSRSVGTATVRATGPDVLLPNASYAVPLIVAPGSGNAQTDREVMVKTNTPTKIDGQPCNGVLVTAAGTDVPIHSMLGGGNKNLTDATQIRWDPPVPGVEAVSTVSGDMTGGVEAASLGQVKRIVPYEGVGVGDRAVALWAAKTGLFPALIVYWSGASPREKMGQAGQLSDHRFRLFVVSSRANEWGARTDEGKMILSYVREIMVDRAEADFEVFSYPPVTLGEGGRFAFDQNSLIYYQDILVRHTARKIQLRTFAPWLASHETITSSTGANPTELTLVDQKQHMPQ